MLAAIFDAHDHSINPMNTNTHEINKTQSPARQCSTAMAAELAWDRTNAIALVFTLDQLAKLQLVPEQTAAQDTVSASLPTFVPVAPVTPMQIAPPAIQGITLQAQTVSCTPIAAVVRAIKPQALAITLPTTPAFFVKSVPLGTT